MGVKVGSGVCVAVGVTGEGVWVGVAAAGEGVGVSVNACVAASALTTRRIAPPVDPQPARSSPVRIRARAAAAAERVNGEPFNNAAYRAFRQSISVR